MEYYALNVYNTARLLYQQLERSTQKVPREDRISSVVEVKRWIEQVMEYIAFANEAFETKENRLQFIRNAINVMHRIEIRVRIYFDLGHIKEKGFDAITNLEASVVRQLRGWEKANS